MSFMYIAVTSRFDIYFATIFLSRFSHAYTDIHYQLALRVLQYLYLTRCKGILYHFPEDGKRKPSSGMSISVGITPNTEVQSDASHNDPSIQRRSTGGLVAAINGSLVAWRAEQFRYVDFSSGESELKQISLSINYSLWFTRMLDTLGIPRPEEFPIYADANVAIRTMNRPQGSSKKFAHLEK